MKAYYHEDGGTAIVEILEDTHHDVENEEGYRLQIVESIEDSVFGRWPVGDVFSCWHKTDCAFGGNWHLDVIEDKKQYDGGAS